MFTKLTSTQELAQIFFEQFYNKQNKVTKASPNSVISGLGFGVAKTAQKVLAETARIEALIFPETATGNELDAIASRSSIPARKGALGSSVYMRLVATQGTIYASGQVFTSSNGIRFTLDESITIGSKGFGFAKCSSTTDELKTNVAPFSIINIETPPSGHIYCINEYSATGGRDIEDDNIFRRRIQNSYNIAAVSTKQRILLEAQFINDKILDVVFQGYDENRKFILSLVTINGQNLTDQELQDLTIGLEPLLSLEDVVPLSNGESRLKLANAEYFPVDISLRCSLIGNNNTETISQIQQNIAEYFNFSEWKRGQTIEWEKLLELCANTKNVLTLPDQYFFPHSDIKTTKNVYPRIRSFQVLNLNGGLISDTDNNLNPVYYPAQVDKQYIELTL